MDWIFYRGIERWLIVIGGLVFAYFGYKLYLYGVDKGMGKLQAENQFFKIALSGSGPGLFFMAFGAMILMSLAFIQAEGTTETTHIPPQQDSPSLSGEMAVPVSIQKNTLKFASVSDDFCVGLKQAAAQDSSGAAMAYYLKTADGTALDAQFAQLEKYISQLNENANQHDTQLSQYAFYQALTEVICHKN